MYTKALGGTYNCTLERTPSEGFQVYGMSHQEVLLVTYFVGTVCLTSSCMTTEAWSTY